MIEFRRRLERARAHPILGPIALIVLVLMLAMVFLHGMHDSHEAVVDFGEICVALAVAISFLILDRFRRASAPTVVIRRADRAPPLISRVGRSQPRIRADAAGYLPLRR